MKAETVKTFPREWVLSVITHRLLCDISGLHQILNHITGDVILSHQVPRAVLFAGPLILERHPELKAAGSEESLAKLSHLLEGMESEKDRSDVIQVWLAFQKLDMFYEIESHANTWLSINPVAEAAMQIGNPIQPEQ